MPDKNVPTIGAVVLSSAGRDEGRYFVVVGLTEDKDYAYISDGALRKIDKPKKKKIKHLVVKNVTIPVVREKIENRERLYDYEIRSHLESLGYNR